MGVLRGELDRACNSPIVLNRALRERLERAVEREGLSMSEIALRCNRVKRDARGRQSGETSWLARRIGQLPEAGKPEPTPWIHSDVLARIARDGSGSARVRSNSHDRGVPARDELTTAPTLPRGDTALKKAPKPTQAQTDSDAQASASDLYEGVPGAELVLEGLADLNAGRESEASVLVEIGAPRLAAVGLEIPQRSHRSGMAPDDSPEHRLYALLARDASPHSRYNALLARIASFASVLEHETTRRR